MIHPLSGRTLRLIAYSLSGSGIPEGDGNVLSFDIRLNGTNGTCFVDPSDVILSNGNSVNMVSATSGQTVTIKLPSIAAPSSLDFGNVAVGADDTLALSVANNGQAPLVVERVEIPDGVFSVKQAFPLVIQPYASAEIPVRFAPTAEGRVSATANIYSNDPVNRLRTVSLAGNAYEDNRLVMSGEPNNDNSEYTLHPPQLM